MIILSFLLQLLLNNYINYNSYFYPLFPLIILIFIDKNNKNKYLFTCLLIGLIYDILFNNIYKLNVLHKNSIIKRKIQIR